MKKTWRNEITDKQKAEIVHGRWNFGEEDFVPNYYTNDIYLLRVLDIKEYDPILNDKSLMTARPYDYFEGDLNDVEKNVDRNERLSPELNINSVILMDNKFMLIQDRTYRVYFDFIDIIPEECTTRLYNITPTAKALNYGFIMQSTIATKRNFNPVIPFFDNTLGYIISTNMYTPVTVNIPKGTLLAYMKRKD